MAWNEPGGEKRNPWNRPQQSQNDLDDVLRNFQRRLAALFGPGGVVAGGAGGQSSPSFRKASSRILIWSPPEGTTTALSRATPNARPASCPFVRMLRPT